MLDLIQGKGGSTETKCQFKQEAEPTCPAKLVTVDFPFVPVIAKILMLSGNGSEAKSNSDITRLPYNWTTV